MTIRLRFLLPLFFGLWTLPLGCDDTVGGGQAADTGSADGASAELVEPDAVEPDAGQTADGDLEPTDLSSPSRDEDLVEEDATSDADPDAADSRADGDAAAGDASDIGDGADTSDGAADAAVDAAEDAAVDTVEDATRDAAEDAAPDTAPPPSTPQVGLLRRNGNPMPCADPTVFSEKNKRGTYYVYCTSMRRVWKTSDWDHFENVRGQVNFRFRSMSANSKLTGSWWAPSIHYAPGADRYIMWVSVPDAQAKKVDGRWDTRSLAVFFSPSPTGPWTFQRMGINAGRGDIFIDPELFLNPTGGGHFVYWKQYGDSVKSRIMGARLNAAWDQIKGNRVEILNGFGGPGTWEDNVRENPAMLYRASTGTWHMMWSGGHWHDHTYATAHSLSNCGPLCKTSGQGWRIRSSGDRNIKQVVQARNLPKKFAHGGPGGAVFQDDRGRFIIYAAAAKGSNDRTRYLMRDRVRWKRKAPYVDRAGHHPSGY